jgi:phage shock protein PspC (stress-responsive transcriptional regulator)
MEPGPGGIHRLVYRSKSGGKFLVVRKSTRLPLARSVAADIGMTGMSWLFICVVPISLLPYVLLQDYLFGGRADPASWIFPVLMSTITGTVGGVAVLFAFRQAITRSLFGLLFAMNLICIGLSVYRMAAYISAHPPEA